MQNKLFVLTICNALAFAFACDQTIGKNYFPLANNARWEYMGRFNSASGQNYNISAKSRVDGETLINGKRYFKYVTTVDFSSVPSISKAIEDVRYYRVSEDGVYVLPGNDPSKRELLEMPLPIPVDLKWMSGTTEVHAERLGTIRVGSREYRDCLKVTFKLADGMHRTENYLVPNVGIIKIMYVNTSEPQSSAELMLEKYIFDASETR